jgi:hypothetical protein
MVRIRALETVVQTKRQKPTASSRRIMGVGIINNMYKIYAGRVPITCVLSVELKVIRNLNAKVKYEQRRNLKQY